MMAFDSSAIMAIIRNEQPGANSARELMDEADVPKFIHSANLCEVFHLVWRIAVDAGQNGSEEANKAVSDFLSLGLIERADMDGAFWRDAGQLIAERRLAGTPLSLGDALGVALTRRLDAQFVTADRSEIEPLQSAGKVDAIFIR